MKPNNNIAKNDLARYTKGKQFTLDSVEYIGEYHIRGSEAWSGPAPFNGSKKLSRYSDSVDVLTYDAIRKDLSNISTYVEPYTMFPMPTKSAYDIGNFTRFFVKDRFLDGVSIIEIDTEQVSNYGNTGGIDSTRYQLESLIWYISNNESTVDRISLLNATNVTILNKRMPGIVDYLPNLFEYSSLSI